MRGDDERRGDGHLDSNPPFGARPTPVSTAVPDRAPCARGSSEL
ncbi:hypothetical protein Pd630_LPD04280 [Rhodococcus opacus PD630]|nr:hypothetical protein Pd630_LPD04280 [Rhodococcus opacus PD630]